MSVIVIVSVAVVVAAAAGAYIYHKVSAKVAARVTALEDRVSFVESRVKSAAQAAVSDVKKV